MRLTVAISFANKQSCTSFCFI